MFDYLAIFLPLGLLILLIILIRIKEGSWAAVLGRDYIALLIILPTLSFSVVSFIFTRKVSTSQLKDTEERKRFDYGIRKLQEEVTFDFKLVKNKDDVDLDIWYKKTPETRTPKNIRIILIPLLCDLARKPKEFVNHEELKKQDLIIELNKERFIFEKNRCKVSAMKKTILERTHIRDYIERKQLECEGIGIEILYNEVQGYLEPLKYFDVKYF